MTDPSADSYRQIAGIQRQIDAAAARLPAGLRAQIARLDEAMADLAEVMRTVEGRDMHRSPAAIRPPE